MTHRYFLNPDLGWYVEQADVVLYDMNGLIVDDEPLHREASNRAIAKLYESEGPQAISDDLWGQQCVGHHPGKWLPEVLRREVDDAELEIFRRQKGEAFKIIAPQKVKEIIRPGVMKALQYFREIKKPLGLVTTSRVDVVNVTLGPGGLNILECFDFKICADKNAAAPGATSESTFYLLPADAKPKPDPAIYMLAKAHFEGKLERQNLTFLVFEDSASGVKAAKGAGMYCFAVPNRYTRNQDLSLADALIESQRFDTLVLAVRKPPAQHVPSCG